ncbi:MAG TPA: trypsin-like peptidase domain-containing protein [Leifsonia sp.]|jgi:putative serine protease PepD|nr:trypsin-like peptidase domain-containing protein [Leifsonia sp.]
MTDTPITPEPAKAQHDADTESAVDAASQNNTETTQETTPVAPAAAAPEQPAAPAAEQPAPVASVDGQQTQQTQQTQPIPPAQPTQPVPPQFYGQQATQLQPNYGQGAFGQPIPQPHQGIPQQPYAPHTQQQPYATQTGAPLPGAAPKTAKKRSTGVIIATFAIGALVGGLAGAGAGVGIYAATGAGSSVVKTATGPQNITVNNSNDATTVTAVAAKASPSVVTISVTGSSAGGTGSGIVLTSDGYILTNTHVVTLDGQASSVSISVQDNSGKIYTAKLIGTDPTTDLAVIKLDGASGLTPMKFADSSKLNVGDTAVAIGAPLGLSGTVTDGIVSALNRSISIASSAAPKSSDGSGGSGSGGSPFNFDFPGQGGSGNGGQSQSQSQGSISLPVIQTDAAINPGNSGGALLNSKGELIGVNVAIASASGTSSGTQSGSIGVGFAIPANLAKRISDDLIKSGSASHGLLGASVGDSSSDNKATTVGAQIKSITSGGAAAGAGLQAGDVIVGFNGVPITSATDLTAQVRALPAGSKADVTYLRGGETKTTSVTLGSASAG